MIRDGALLRDQARAIGGSEEELNVDPPFRVSRVA